MDAGEIERLFQGINPWKRGDERAPHKPLLLLYALGRASRGEPRWIPYADVDRDLRDLLIEFGPSRRSHHPEYPFWRLQNDALWELQGAEQLESRKGKDDAKKSELLKHHVQGALPEPIFEAVQHNPRLLASLAQGLLDAHFPSTFHEDILREMGLELPTQQVSRTPRDPEFRTKVLVAYEYRCAVCGFDVRLGNVTVGLEAAHIKWHQAGGPDQESNGLALCVLHHKLFDRGGFTISAELVIELSARLHGSNGFQEHLLAYHAQPIREPQNPNCLPDANYLNWHHKEVFQGPARHRPDE